MGPVAQEAGAAVVVVPVRGVGRRGERRQRRPPRSPRRRPSGPSVAQPHAVLRPRRPRAHCRLPRRPRRGPWPHHIPMPYRADRSDEQQRKTRTHRHRVDTAAAEVLRPASSAALRRVDAASARGRRSARVWTRRAVGRADVLRGFALRPPAPPRRFAVCARGYWAAQENGVAITETRSHPSCTVPSYRSTAVLGPTRPTLPLI